MPLHQELALDAMPGQALFNGDDLYAVAARELKRWQCMLKSIKGTRTKTGDSDKMC